MQSGQMRKSEFLKELKRNVCSTAEEALRGTIWSAMGCPYIDRWFSHYSNQSSEDVERALRKYAPETTSVKSAREYIPLVTQRVRQRITVWANTGEVTGVPEELAQGGMPGVTAGGLVGGLVSGALSAVGSAVSGLVSGVGGAISGIGRMSLKERETGTREATDPEGIRTQLGTGQGLDGGVREQMQTAYGVDFSRVRVHTDTKAQELSDHLNARAFTIGSDIAFGAGEYQPGTLIGDALIAHELAHVMQQGRANAAAAPLQKGGAASDSLEEDADLSAVGAVLSPWGRAKGALADITHDAMPRLRSGLRLQRCGGGAKEPSTAGPTQTGRAGEKAPGKPPVAEQAAAKPPAKIGDQIPHSIDQRLSQVNINQAIEYFRGTDVATRLVQWLQGKSIKVKVLFLADANDMPPDKKEADGTYEEVDSKSFNVYVLGTMQAIQRDARGGTYNVPAGERKAEDIAGTIFDELLHVWFVNVSPTLRGTYRDPMDPSITGHRAGASAGIFRGTKIYNE